MAKVTTNSLYQELIHMLVFLNGLETPLENFHFGFTVDYARLMDMIETDLFNLSHGLETQYFDFRMYY